jgi:signal peptidase II
MLEKNYKKILLNLLALIFIFALDRISKLYIIKLAEINNSVDIYLSSYLNLNLIWNRGIAFGMLSFDESVIYNFITILIIIVNLIILIMIVRSNDIKCYFLIFILGGSMGNLFDRLYYYAVPDFIDFHINGFHWFIFNVADIFISLGVICLIFVELFLNKKTKNEIK